MEEDSLIPRLAHWGCDTRGALDRMLGDEAFYRECLTAFYRDSGFPLLGNQLERGDVRDAFETAHMLKGVAANLGLTPLYSTICTLAEPLRAGRLGGAPEAYRAVARQREELGRCISV